MISGREGQKYYHADELEREQYYKLSKNLIHGEEYRDLSSEAKMAYAFLIDRMELSFRNSDDFVDDFGRTFIYYTRENLATVMGISLPTIRKVLDELKKHRLIEEVQQGQGKPNRIYVLKTIGHYKYFQTEKNFQSRVKNSFSLEGKDFSPNNTDINNTDIGSHSFLKDRNGTVITDYNSVYSFLWKESYAESYILDANGERELECELFPMAIQVLSEMVCNTSENIKVGDGNINLESLISKLNEILYKKEISDFPLYITTVVEDYAKACRQQKIKKMKNYMGKCLWQGMFDYSVKFHGMFERTYYFGLKE